MIERLSLDIKTFPAVFEHLTDAQHNLSLSITMGTNPQGQLASAIQFCRKALEALLKEVARQSPINDAYKLLTGDATIDRATVENIASAVGFSSPVPDKIREAIGGGSDTKERIKSIGKNLKNVFSLNAAIVATLLASSKDSSHPFRNAAKRDPDLLTKFIAIVDFATRPPMTHLTTLSLGASLSRTPTQIRELTLEVAACLLDLPIQGKRTYMNKKKRRRMMRMSGSPSSAATASGGQACPRSQRTDHTRTSSISA